MKVYVSVYVCKQFRISTTRYLLAIFGMKLVHGILEFVNGG